MSEPKVHIIDDDDAARDALEFLLVSADLPVVAYDSAEAFLAGASEARGCVVTDLRMPRMDGLELVRRLKDLGALIPVIVMTGHGDVPLAVEAMKAGVVDFIEKPFDDERMLAAIGQALSRADEGDAHRARLSDIRARLQSLSGREREVLDGIVSGKANKVIAYDLDISPRTVEIYRANVMAKMGAQNLSGLVRMVFLVSGA